MNIVHLHLLLNHLPVIGSVFATLLLAVALFRRSGELTRVSLWFWGLLGVASVLVFLTGEPAQDAVERFPGFSDTLAERHEDAALVATIVTAGIGALALAALFVFRRRTIPRWLTTLGLVAALGSSVLMGYAANLGGQIRHTEIRPGAVSSQVSPVRPTEVEREH